MIKKVVVLALSLIMVLSLGACGSNEDSKTVSEGIDKAVEAVNEETAEVQDPAVADAIKYLESMPSSEKDLKVYLQNLGYATDEAEEAIENCGADWYEEAAERASMILGAEDVSKDSLQIELESLGFTTDQAVYAVDKVF